MAIDSHIVLRLAKSATVCAMALFASMAAFNNITDPAVNFAAVKHALAMDGIFEHSQLSWRSIENPVIATGCFIVIIALESLTALLCWIGAAIMLTKLNQAEHTFRSAKSCAIIGLTLGFLAWQVIFMSIGEWFVMWQSAQWTDTAHSAFRIFITFLLVLIFVASNEPRRETTDHR